MSLFQMMMVAALLVGGMGVALLGSVKVPLARSLQIDEGRVGGLVSVFGFVMIPVILTAGFLTDLVGREAVLIGGSAMMGASLLLLAQARGYAVALAAVLLLGAGWSFLINVGNVLTPLAFRGDSMAYATNLANVFFGMGAFLTPLLAAALVGRTSLAAAMSILGGLTLLPALLAAPAEFPAPFAAAAEGAAEAGLGDLLADPLLWLCGLALFFYGPIEASVAAWTTTYLGGRGVPEATATRLLSGFWLAFMLSRLATAFLLPPGRETALILALALASAAVLLAVVLSADRTTAVALVVVAGLVFGPIFPTLIAVLLGGVPDTLHGRAVGLFFALGGIGWTVVPLLIGAYARRVGVQRGFVVAVAAAGLLSVVALLLVTRETWQP